MTSIDFIGRRDYYGVEKKGEGTQRFGLLGVDLRDAYPLSSR